MWSLPISRCLEEREMVFVHPVEYVTETECSKKFSFFHTMGHITEVELSDDANRSSMEREFMASW